MPEKELLLHICCGPCGEYPVQALREEGISGIKAYFFNPNIQPKKEMQRRRESVERFAKLKNLDIIVNDRCDEAVWRAFASKEKAKHCFYCYNLRFNEAARMAKELGYKAFTSTLFVSPWQDYETMCEVARRAAERHGVKFLERDFRPGYRKGQQMAKEDGLYRQRFCGCIYSLGESNFKEQIMKQLDLTAEDVPERICSDDTRRPKKKTKK